MKNLFFAVLIFVFSSFLLCTHSQDNGPKIPVIDVQGSASIRIVPDIMTWYVSVKIDSDDQIEAKKDNDRSVEMILRALKDYGIDNKDIQTGGLKIVKNYQYYGSNIKKFNISNDVWFKLRDISKYDDLTSALIGINDVYINSTNLEYSKSIELREQARNDALLAAKKKAEQMADVLGMAIGKPVLISEEPLYYGYANPFNNVSYETGPSSYGTSTTFREGEVEVEAKVKVVFELISK